MNHTTHPKDAPGVLSKGPFNNYLDKMRVKKCLFLSSFRVKKSVHAGGGGQKMAKFCPRNAP